MQFQTVSIIIDADVIKYKVLKIQLVEQVNKLDAVILSSGLTGNIEKDMGNVKTVKPIVIDMGNMDASFDYHDDRASDNLVVLHDLKSKVNKGELYNGLNIARILGLNKLFKRRKDAKDIKNDLLLEKPKKLLDVYSKSFINENFIAFVEREGIKSELFEQENEIKLIEFLIKQSELFLKKLHVKN